MQGPLAVESDRPSTARRANEGLVLAAQEAVNRSESQVALRQSRVKPERSWIQRALFLMRGRGLSSENGC